MYRRHYLFSNKLCRLSVVVLSLFLVKIVISYPAPHKGIGRVSFSKVAFSKVAFSTVAFSKVAFSKLKLLEFLFYVLKKSLAVDQ